MANKFSQMAKNMGAFVEDEEPAVDVATSAALPVNRETVVKAQAAQKPKKKTDSPAPAEDLVLSKKTIHLPLELDWAIKELKDKRNMAKQIRREKGRTTEDEIIVEALGLFFRQKGPNHSSLESAREKLKNYQ